MEYDRERIAFIDVQPFAGGQIAFPDHDHDNVAWRVSLADAWGETLSVLGQYECPEAAAKHFHGEYVALAADIPHVALSYTDPLTSTAAACAAAFGDRLAEALWACIARHGTSLLSPQEYGQLATDHPLDDFRDAFLCAAMPAA